MAHGTAAAEARDRGTAAGVGGWPGARGEGAAAAGVRAIAADAAALAAGAATRGRPPLPFSPPRAAVAATGARSAAAALSSPGLPSAEPRPETLCALGGHASALLASNYALRRDLIEAKYRESHSRYAALEAGAAATAYRAAPLGSTTRALEDSNFEAARAHLHRLAAREPLADAQLAARALLAQQPPPRATPATVVPAVARELARLPGGLLRSGQPPFVWPAIRPT
ncbi:hypothetical protein T492DRAFT_915540 [Pavlovales sp. CCMP2436]|nr:hypothetical protein T492DRAFT_915540 [Pavlovales sp. CCMP2436]